MRLPIRYFLLVLLCTTFVRSQTRTTGDLSGVATDPSGAVVPNATITLTHKSTGATQTSTTDSAGSYRFALLPPGEYVAAAAKVGFQTITNTVQVSLGGSLTANFQFSVVSSTHEVVAVTASAGELNKRCEPEHKLHRETNRIATQSGQ